MWLAIGVVIAIGLRVTEDHRSCGWSDVPTRSAADVARRAGRRCAPDVSMHGIRSRWPHSATAPSAASSERVQVLALDSGVTATIVAPAQIDPRQRVELILYALPNGNTTAQTIGRALGRRHATGTSTSSTSARRRVHCARAG